MKSCSVVKKKEKKMFATLSSVYRFVIPFISFVVSSIQHQHEPLDMSECASTDKT